MESREETQMEHNTPQESAPIPKDAIIEYRSNGTVRSITANNLAAEFSHETTYTSHLQERAFPELAAYILRQYGPLLKIENTSTELTLSENKTDSLGYRQVRFRQTLDHRPVLASEIVVHFDNEDAPYLIQGNYLATPDQFNSIPALSPEAALNSAAEAFPSATFGEPFGPAIWVDDKGQASLVYVVLVEQSMLDKSTVLIDANTGLILIELPATYSQSL